MALARNSVAVAEEYSPRAMVARSFERHRVAWMAGAAGAGLVLMRLLFSGGGGECDDDLPRDHAVPSSRSRGLLGLLTVPLLAYGKKMAMSYGTQFVQSWLSGQKTPQDDAPPGV